MREALRQLILVFILKMQWFIGYKAMFHIPQLTYSQFHDFLFFLPKHPGAAQMLRDIAAVDFLTQLSPNVEPRLRAVIDGTLDQLCHLPDLLPSQGMVYVDGSHTGAATGVASNSQIFFSCLDSVCTYKLWSIQGTCATLFAQMCDCGLWCFICNISSWRRTSCGLFPKGWTGPSRGTAPEDSRYWCFKKALRISFFACKQHTMFSPCAVQCMSLWSAWSFLCSHGWRWQTRIGIFSLRTRGEGQICC